MHVFSWCDNSHQESCTVSIQSLYRFSNQQMCHTFTGAHLAEVFFAAGLVIFLESGVLQGRLGDSLAEWVLGKKCSQIDIPFWWVQVCSMVEQLEAKGRMGTCTPFTASEELFLGSSWTCDTWAQICWEKPMQCTFPVKTGFLGDQQCWSPSCRDNLSMKGSNRR